MNKALSKTGKVCYFQRPRFRMDVRAQYWVPFEVLLGDRLMVGLQILILPIGVRVPVPQPNYAEIRFGLLLSYPAISWNHKV